MVYFSFSTPTFYFETLTCILCDPGEFLFGDKKQPRCLVALFPPQSGGSLSLSGGLGAVARMPQQVAFSEFRQQLRRRRVRTDQGGNRFEFLAGLAVVPVETDVGVRRQGRCGTGRRTALATAGSEGVFVGDLYFFALPRFRFVRC